MQDHQLEVTRSLNLNSSVWVKVDCKQSESPLKEGIQEHIESRNKENIPRHLQRIVCNE